VTKVVNVASRRELPQVQTTQFWDWEEGVATGSTQFWDWEGVATGSNYTVLGLGGSCSNMMNAVASLHALFLWHRQTESI
jgi:hypothetical protein